MDTTTYTQDAIIERIDDIPLLVSLQQRLGLSEVIDQQLSRHWLHQGLSLGQLVVGWTTFILSQGDHRKVTVRDWVADHQGILEDLWGWRIRDTDFTDDRLGQVLTHLSDDGAWEGIEEEVWQRSVEVYRLIPQRVRLDATRVHGYHGVEDEGLMQYGYSSDHRTDPQIKVMVGSVDMGTNGHLVATDVVSGQQADDPLYVPVLARLRAILKEPGLLYIGDSKMSALATRADIVYHGDVYLVPLSEVGEVPQLLSECRKQVVAGDQPAALIFTKDVQGKARLLGAGYETSREQIYPFADGRRLYWSERVLVIRSPDKVRKQQASLQRRLEQATEALLALTPPVGRGRRPVRDEATLHTQASGILDRFGVKAYLHYRFRREETTRTQFVGRGRGSATRPQRTVTQVRYVISGVELDQPAITQAIYRMGWRLYATNATPAHLSLEDALKLYRKAPRIERHFHLFKEAPVGIEPLYVRRDDQIKGLTRLLSLTVRLLTLIEILARRNLTQQQQKLEGLYEGNPKQKTDQPTAIRLLKAFRFIDRVQLKVQGDRVCYITPLSPLQQQILSILELDETIYQVPFQNSG